MGNELEIVMIGFGGHARVMADSINKTGKYKIAGYIDPYRREASRYEYLGTDGMLAEVYHAGIRYAALGIGFMGNPCVRDELVMRAREIGFEFPIILDPSAEIASDARLGDGIYVGKKAVVNAGSVVGDYCIINTGAVVEHDNTIGDYTHIAVGALLCGDVHVGNHVFIGAGTTIIQGRHIGDECMVGAGSLVLGNVENKSRVSGIIKMARGGKKNKLIWPRRYMPCAA